MRKLSLAVTLVALTVPFLTQAIDFTDVSDTYTDAPFSQSEAAGISLLTSLGVVSGNPDGSFAPARALTRAEFLKIALRSAPSFSMGAAATCFPDVTADDWFSPYVCAAKDAGVVQGYPDGLFHPEQDVIYAEALKILVEAAEYALAPVSGEEWYEQYYRAAAGRGTLLPVSVSAGSPLTRGLMARLTAGFVAEREGQLQQYRLAEQGRLSSSSASSDVSSSSTSSQSSSSLSSSLSSSSSSSSAAMIPGLPARSRFLTLGTMTLPIASATFRSALEPAYVRTVTIKVPRELQSVQSFEIVDSVGTLVSTLSLDTTDEYDLTWKGTTFGTGAYVLPLNTERVLAVRARIKPRENGGRPEEMIQIQDWSVTVDGQWSSSSYNSERQNFVFPQSQTVQGQILAVHNAQSSEGHLMRTGTQILASFSFSGSSVAGAPPPSIENLEFNVSKSEAVAVTDWFLSTPGGTTRLPCSVNGTTISCLVIPQEIGAVGTEPKVVQLSGTVVVDQSANGVFLQVQLVEPGSTSVLGAVQWTDGTGHYRWLDVPYPVGQGTLWRD